MRRTVEVFDRKNKSKITTLESEFPLLSVEFYFFKSSTS